MLNPFFFFTGKQYGRRPFFAQTIKNVLGRHFLQGNCTVVFDGMNKFVFCTLSNEG